LAHDLRPQQLGLVTRTVSFERLPEVFAAMQRSASHGRTVVQIATARVV
jgi:hypothetical protein